MVEVRLDAGDQPSYAIATDAAWDAIATPGPKEVRTLAKEGFAALICGTLAQRCVASR